jgi:hypothetical protein
MHSWEQSLEAFHPAVLGIVFAVAHVQSAWDARVTKLRGRKDMSREKSRDIILEPCWSPGARHEPSLEGRRRSDEGRKKHGLHLPTEKLPSEKKVRYLSSWAAMTV